MSDPRGPFIRAASLIIIAALLLYLPTREFLKVTFILGIPFILFAALMKRNVRYSPLWIVSALGLLLVAGFYFYTLSYLPERIETRRIIMDGERLLAEEKYDEAEANYRKLGPMGEINKMNDKISRVESEKLGKELVGEARELMAAGDQEKARETLQKVPSDTRAAQEAVKMLRTLQ